MPDQVKPYTALAEEWGVPRQTIGALVKLHGIPFRPVPHSPNSKGLDRAGQRRVRRLLGLDKPHPVNSA